MFWDLKFVILEFLFKLNVVCDDNFYFEKLCFISNKMWVYIFNICLIIYKLCIWFIIISILRYNIYLGWGLFLIMVEV